MKQNSFKRNNRLLERKDFLALFESPKIFKARTFQAFFKDNNLGAPRLGITIKSKSLSSVWRMRVKRTVREWFRTRKTKLGSIDVNIVLRMPHVVTWSFIESLKKDLEKWVCS